jgi:glutathione S-transferase
VCALARHLRLPIDFRYVDVARGAHKAPQFLALNPNGQVPVLEDGGRVLPESNAILVHLATRAQCGLWPRDPYDQAQVMRWFGWEMDRFTRAGGELYFQYAVRPRFGLGPAEPDAVAGAIRDFRAAATILDAHLADRAWLLGDAMSVADFAVAGVLPYAEDARIPVRHFPHVTRWHARLNELPAWREPFPPTVAAAGDAGARHHA